MKYFFAVLGFIVGVLLVIVILAMYSAATDSQMPNPFIPANIVGIILAIVGYNYRKK